MRDKGVVSFWPRDRLVEKFSRFLDDMEAQQKLSPGTASKVYGMANFLEQGIFGRVGCAGLAAIKHRQQEHNSSLTPALQQSLAVLRELLRVKPRREFEVVPQRCDRFVAASDAALEAPRAGTGGFHIIWLHEGEQSRDVHRPDSASHL